MLTYIFGDLLESQVTEYKAESARGNLKLELANNNWKLSIDYIQVYENVQIQVKRTFRTIQMEGEEVEFSDGLTELHTRSYQEILKGK